MFSIKSEISAASPLQVDMSLPSGSLLCVSLQLPMALGWRSHHPKTTLWEQTFTVTNCSFIPLDIKVPKYQGPWGTFTHVPTFFQNEMKRDTFPHF